MRYLSMSIGQNMMLNNNMRCFEIGRRDIKTGKNISLNNNMRCFEIRLQKGLVYLLDS